MSSTQAFLHELDRRILQEESWSGLLEFVANGLLPVYRCDSVWIATYTENYLSCRCAQAGPAILPTRLGLEIRDDAAPAQALLTAVLATGEAQLAEMTVAGQGEAAILALPLRYEGAVIGALLLSDRRRHAFSRRVVARRAALADQIAISLASARRLAHLRLLEQALQASANAMVVTDHRGVIEWANPAFTSLTGYAGDEVIGITPRVLKSGLNGDDLYRHLWETITAGGVWVGQLWNRRKDGSLYVEEMTVTPVRDRVDGSTHFIAVKEDITARRRHEEQITYQAHHDALTGVLNRAAFMKRLEHALAVRQPGVLFMIDIDAFKRVNDVLGHAAGDQVLEGLARLMIGNLCHAEIIGRLGGDEFAILLPKVDADEARVVADRLRSLVNAADFGLGADAPPVSISIGAVAIAAVHSAKEALLRADQALYSAKSQGRNRTVFLLERKQTVADPVRP